MARKSRNTINARIALTGAAEIKRDLAELGTAGKVAFAGIEKAAGKDISAQFTKSIATVKRDLRPLGRAFGDLGSSITRMGRNLSIAFAGIGAATAGVVAFTKNATEAADAVGKQAQGVGLAANEFQRLQFAAEQSGIAQADFTTGLTRLNQEIGRAAAGNAASVERFEQLGVAVRDANGEMRPTEAILSDLATAFSRMPDDARKAAIGAELFGRSVARWLPLLNEGREGIAALGDEFGTTIGGFSEAQIRLATETNDAMAAMGRAARNVRHQIGLAFAPSVLRGTRAFQEFIQRNRVAIVAFAEDIAGRVEPVIADLFNTLAGNDADVVDRRFVEWRESVTGFGRDVKDVVEGVVVPAWRALVNAAESVARGIGAVFGIDVNAQQVLMVAAIGKITGAFAVLGAAARVAVAAIAFFAKHPVIAGLLMLAGRLATLANQQSIAERAAADHKRALDELDSAMAAVGTQSSEARDNLRRKPRPASRPPLPRRELLKAAREELALGLAIKQVDALGLSGSANADQIIANAFQEQLKALDDLGGSQDEYIAGLQHRVRELGKADKETVALTKTVAESGRAIERASEAAAKFPGPAAHIRTVGDAFGGAKREAENLGDAVEGGGKKTETAVERMAAHIRTVPAEWRNAGTAATDAASATTAAADATAASIRKVPVALTEAGTGATAALEPVSVALDGMAAKSAEVATGLPGQFDSAATEIADAFASAFGRVRSDLDALVSAVTAAISRMSAALAALKSEIASTKAAASSAGSSGSGSSGGGGSGFWRGGQVHGPGTSTSDSIFARLSRGEFVIRAAAVEKFGPQFFAALNSLRLPKDMLKGFNMGGMVDGWNSSMSSLMPVPAFNHGGEVGASSGGRPVTLVLPNGERVEGMTATSDAVDQFMRHVRTKAHRAAGKSPGWVR